MPDSQLASPAPPALKPAAYGWLKPMVFIGGLMPLAVYLLRWLQGTLEAEPIAELLNAFGKLALIFLLLSLACTPLKIVSAWTWPLRLRKLMGLFAFFYAALHLSLYMVGNASTERFFEWQIMWEDVSQRPFIFLGMAAFLTLVPLAVTSTNNMVRRLGARRWQMLHRLAYVAAILGAIHFYMRVKADVREPLIYAGILAVLLGIRGVAALRRAKSV